MSLAIKPIFLRAPIFAAALIQCVAFWLSWRISGGHPAFAIAMQASCAALLTFIARLPRWWIALQAAFPICVALALWAQIPPWIYLAAFIALGLVYGNIFFSRIPLYLSNSSTLEALDRWLIASPASRFIDLGCGTGTVLRHLAARHPATHFEGVEKALLPLVFGVLRARSLRNVRLHARDLWRADLTHADIVYVFLSPIAMERVWLRACAEMRPGSYLISRSFGIPGVPPTQTLAAGEASLYIWRIPERAG